MISEKIRHPEKLLIISVLFLLIIGSFALYSASSFKSLLRTDSTSSTYYIVRHLGRIAVAIIAGIFAYRLNNMYIKRGAVILYLLSLLFLILLTVLKGTNWAPVTNGSARWLVLGGSVRFMPSEFARISFILASATLMASTKLKLRTFTGVGVLTAMAIVPAGIIVFQPDLAGALYLISILFVMLFLGEARFRDIMLLGLSMLLIASVFAFSSEYRRARIKSWITPDIATEASNYQPEQACIALGSGGFLGRGLGRGRQQRGFLPEAYSDYIIAVIGEESGFIGVFFILLLLFAVTISGFMIADGADNRFGYLLAGGLTASIAIGALFHIGVSLRVLPSTGLPLPLISWGGSNLIVTLGGVGLISKVAQERVKT